MFPELCVCACVFGECFGTGLGGKGEAQKDVLGRRLWFGEPLSEFVDGKLV